MDFSMDLFDWSQLPDHFEADIFSTGLEDVLPERNDTASLGWTDYFTPSHSLNETPALTQRSGSSVSSTDDSCRCQDGGEGSQNEAVDEDETVTSRSTGRPRTPLHNGRDSVSNRIQRRRTQNRNSQRIYRQRRMEERQRFEERAIAAEEASKQLRMHLAELHSVIAYLKFKVEQLQVENATIRRGNQ